jgi:hypothetical protein
VAPSAKVPEVIPVIGTWFDRKVSVDHGWKDGDKQPDGRHLWSWAHFGGDATGWIEFCIGNVLHTSFSKEDASWELNLEAASDTNEKEVQIMVTFGTKIHFIAPSPSGDSFHVVGLFEKNAQNVERKWRLMMGPPEGFIEQKKPSKTTGWPYFYKQEFGYAEDAPGGAVSASPTG